MTNKEAIRILSNIKPYNDSNAYEIGEAISKAIEALKFTDCDEQMKEYRIKNIMLMKALHH